MTKYNQLSYLNKRGKTSWVDVPETHGHQLTDGDVTEERGHLKLSHLPLTAPAKRNRESFQKCCLWSQQHQGVLQVKKIHMLLVCRLQLYRLSGQKVAGSFPLKRTTGETSST